MPLIFNPLNLERLIHQNTKQIFKNPEHEYITYAIYTNII